MKLGYFPGCSLHSSAHEYDLSLKSICRPLGITLEEIRDWACCGATSAHVTNHLLALALPARTLALAEEQGLKEVLAPCAACYSRLATARQALEQDKNKRAKISAILERPFSNTVQVKNILEVLRAQTGDIKKKAIRPLAGLKVACYYGCLLVRPPEVTGFDDAEAPTAMEEIVQAAGATPVVWNRRLDCCGSGLSLSRTGSVVRLGRLILEDALAAGAGAIIAACPMCHMNLDLRQKAMAQRGQPFEVPILFVTQLLGLAMGLMPRELGLERHFVSTDALLRDLVKTQRDAASPRSGT